MQSTRQSELFAGQDWQILYRAFVDINFNASDPPSINRALRDYIKTNYPEDFDDWIESSEFVAIIDMLSWLAGNLAFKTDIAARENFLETAEARESVLRLARQLSYTPSRCQPAQGVVKLVEVSTDDFVQDSFGVSLANVPVSWNNPDDPNWFERFTTILNNALVSTNPFGVPFKSGTLAGGLPTQLYRVNGRAGGGDLGFSATVSGTSMSFEVCNGDFDDGGTIRERGPNPNAAFHFYYLNDGNGYASARNGFFMLFKQGVTSSNLYNIPTPVENKLIDINSTGINQNDVWVQTIDDDGSVMIDWTKVPAVLSANTTYNSLPREQRNIFSAITRDQDSVSIRFSDGRFGNAPTGNLRVTYRVSNGLTYAIKPQEINRIKVPITYVNRDGASRTLYLTFSLFETIANATAAETTDQVRQRAPLVYATQNRMVSGEDYNTFPLSTNLAVKLKAVNRVYSGHSRYIDLNDPTGTYRDLSIFADDGILFREKADRYTEVPLTMNRTADDIVSNTIQPMLRSVELLNAVRDVFVRALLYPTTPALIPAPVNLVWNKAQSTNYSSTGYLSLNNTLVVPGAMVQVQEGSAKPRWVGVVAVTGSVIYKPAASLPGPVALADTVADQARILKVMPRYLAELPLDIVNAIKDKVEKRLSFSLWYDYATNGGRWLVQNPVSGGLGRNEFNADSPPLLLVMTADYTPGLWRVNARGLRFVFESAQSVEWYDDGSRALDSQTGVASNDLVRVLRFNEDLTTTNGRALKRDFDFAIDRLWFYPNGTAEPRRTKVTLIDSDDDGFPDDPDAFYRVVAPSEADLFLFWQKVETPFETALVPSDSLIGGGVWVYASEYLRTSATVIPPVGTVGFQIASGSILRENTFWVWTNDGWVQDLDGTYRFAIGRGPNVGARYFGPNGEAEPYGGQINFHWKHYAPSNHRIDPAQSNLHDMFVLTSSYDSSMRQWVSAGADVVDMPLPPSEFDLRIAFNSLDQFRMFSDQIVWRPVRYKLLFGNAANDELRAQFKVVRLPNAQISDGEIKTRVIRAVNQFFDVSNWDFGETFFYTELAAYIHHQLATLIGSCVIVPLNSKSSFGDGFEVACRSDEIFLSTAQVNDVVLIGSNTPANLRIR